MQVWLGTSGYSYPDWVGSFYPAGTSASRMLGHYVQAFPLAELNFSFYRLPTASMLARLAEQTPDDFRFIVKMPKTLSHDESPTDLHSFRAALVAMTDRGKLAGVLCQLPQATHRTKAHAAWIELLAKEYLGLGLAVEFRHRSWADADVPAWLSGLGVHLVSVDAPAIPALYPTGLVQSSDLIYVRFHSRNAQNWYLGDKERYDYDYDDAALAAWVASIRAASRTATRAFLLFNNCMRSQAAANAQRMRQLFAQLAPELTVVAPPPTPRQRSLFDGIIEA